MGAVIALLMAFMLGLPLAAQATIYYVATNGDNNNDGTSENTPFLTVKKAVDTMLAGDTTYVKSGTYNEGIVRFLRSGTQSAPIKLLNYPGQAPTIRCIDPNTQLVLAQASGGNTPIGWITIEGFEITNCFYGFKYYNLHDSVIRGNWIHHNPMGAGIQGNGVRIVIDRNIINSNAKSRANHGIYANGSYYTVTNNVFYDSYNWQIQLNAACSNNACYNPSIHAGPEFARSDYWVIANNTFAYSLNRGGIVLYGSEMIGTRIENNIFYENCVNCSSATSAAIDFFASAPASVTIRNNHVYMSGSGGQAYIVNGCCAIENTHYTQSGNVVNVSPPAFVDGGSNSLPTSPDFSLTASAPVNIARANEFLNNSTNVVGAFKTVATPTGSIIGQTVTLTMPMSTAVPIRNLSTAGVSVGCSGSNCPVSPTVSSVTRRLGTDTQVDITISGIAGNACVSTDQNWTISYDSSTGTWTGNDNIGPYPGLHQQIFSFTNLAVTNLCDGTSPPAPPSGSYAQYLMEDGSGTTISDTSGNTRHATLSGGSWVSGHTGFGLSLGNGSQMVMPFGSDINPATQDMTWVVAIFVPSGQENTGMFLYGNSSGDNQRAYIGAWQGTWRIARQTLNAANAGASNQSVTSGWQHLCVNWNATTDTVTLYKDGVVGTGGATGTYTPYTFTGDFEIPIIDPGFSTTPTATYDDVHYFTTLEDCAALYADWNPPPPPPSGSFTFSQDAVQAQHPFTLTPGGAPINLGAVNASFSLPEHGAIAWVFQIHCDNVADCDATSFRFSYRLNGAGAWLPIQNSFSVDQVAFYGESSEPLFNDGATTARLSGTCAVTTGLTVLSSSQIPPFDLPQDGCVMLRIIMKVGAFSNPKPFIEIRGEREGGVEFTGAYTALARINVIPLQASAGF